MPEQERCGGSGQITQDELRPAHGQVWIEKHGGFTVGVLMVCGDDSGDEPIVSGIWHRGRGADDSFAESLSNFLARFLLLAVDPDCGELPGVPGICAAGHRVDQEKARHLGHRVVLAFDSGGMFARLICPDPDSCEHTGSCPDCAADLTDPDSDRCEHCEEVSPSECWLQSWFDAVIPEDDLLHGEIEFPVSVEWIDGAPEVQIEAGGDASCR